MIIIIIIKLMLIIIITVIGLRCILFYWKQYVKYFLYYVDREGRTKSFKYPASYKLSSHLNILPHTNCQVI